MTRDNERKVQEQKDELNRLLNESTDTKTEFTTALIPENITLETTCKNGLYTLDYTEIFHNYSNSLMNDICQKIQDIYNNMKGQEKDIITVTPRAEEDLQIIALHIETSNPHLYLYSLSGELLIQSIAHYARDKPNFMDEKDEYIDTLMESTSMLAKVFTALPLVLDSDARYSCWRGY